MKPAYLNMLIAVLLAVSGTALCIEESGDSAVYKVVGNRIVFPDYDASGTSEPKTLLEISVDDFPGQRIIAGRLLLSEGSMVSTPFQIPKDATSITIWGRSLPTASIFPRIKISLVFANESQLVLFEGYWQTLSLESQTWQVPDSVWGKKAKLKIEFLNKATIEERRNLWFYKAAFY